MESNMEIYYIYGILYMGYYTNQRETEYWVSKRLGMRLAVSLGGVPLDVPPLG